MPKKRNTRKVNTHKKTKTKVNTTGLSINNIIMFIIYIALGMFVLLADMEYCGPLGMIVKNTIITLFGTIGHYFYLLLFVIAIMTIINRGNNKISKIFLLLFFVSIISFVSAYIDNIDYNANDVWQIINKAQENAIITNAISTDTFSAGIISTVINYYLVQMVNRAGLLVVHGFFVVLFFLLSFGIEGIQIVKKIIFGVILFVPNMINKRKETKREDIRINIENERKLNELLQRKEREKMENKKFVGNITTEELMSMGLDAPYAPQSHNQGHNHNEFNDEIAPKTNDRLIQMDQDLNKVKILDSSKFVYDTEKINVDVENMRSRFFRLNDLNNNETITEVERKQRLLNEMKEKSINEINQEQKDLSPADFFYDKTNNENKEQMYNEPKEDLKQTNANIDFDMNVGLTNDNSKELDMMGVVSSNGVSNNGEKKEDSITNSQMKKQEPMENPFDDEDLVDVVTDDVEEDNVEEIEETEVSEKEVLQDTDEEGIDEEDVFDTVEDSEEIDDEDEEESEVEVETSEEDSKTEDIPDVNDEESLSVENDFNKKLDNATETPEEKEIKKVVKKPRSRKAPRKYKTPPLYLLKKSEKQKNVDKEYLKETAQTLQSSLAQFGVGAKVTRVTVGPTVTRYELTPSQGVRVKKFIELQDDIKLAMAATDIRIEAPIPGKSAVGIEVPNKVIKPVLLGDLVSSSDFRNSESKVSACIGRDIAGNNIICDISTLPHLLVAGSTGSGKSVCINSIIMSLIYKSSPEDVRLILVDPKVVELQIYNDLPHLLVPVVTDPKRAAASLNWAVSEMDRRYILIMKEQVRNIDDYNKRVEEYNQELLNQENQENEEEVENRNVEAEAEETKEKKEKLPRIVIIIDEFSDLMMVASKDVENAITRIAQLARACGIYLIIATQRPSVNVISGRIKANVPGRIAFAVSSGIDSRTILDQYGAEKLIGKGDMLYSPTGIPKPIRVQGCYISDEEIKRVVKFVKDPNVTFDDEIDKQITENSKFDNEESKERDPNSLDDYFVEAGKLIIQSQIASSGFLQRKLQIGFNRASRILDQLADNGVVTEQDGKKPREILMELNEFLDTFDV